MSIEVSSAIYTKLVADANVTAKLGTFGGSPAMFTGHARENILPEGAAYVLISPPFAGEQMGTKNANDKSREETCKVVLSVAEKYSIVAIEALEKAVRDSLHRQDLGTIGSATMEIVDVSPGIDLSDRDYFVRALDVRVLARE